MGRRPLVLETWGTFYTREVSKGRWVARARYRDEDGRSRLIERTERTKHMAEDAVRAAMRDRLKPLGDGELGPETRIANDKRRRMITSDLSINC
jgi:hypothetical protein